MKRKPWTPDDVKALMTLYPDNTAAAVAKTLGREVGSVYQKSALMGLKKSAAFFASDSAGRIQRGQQHPGITATRFQPGMTPWNKGIAYDSGGRSHETRFQKGRLNGRAANLWQPVGAYRLCEGHLQLKTGTTPGPAHRRWTPVARLVWQAAHGPIPAGHLIVFKRGCMTNVLELITPEKLDCISRAENARRNHPRNTSPEFAKLTQLKGAITRQVNRITREAKQAKEKATA